MSETNDAAPLGPEEVEKTRGGRRQRQKRVTPIETANNTSDADFLNEYVKPSSGSWPQWTHPGTRAAYALSLSGPGDLCDEELDACFNLVDETSGADYRNSSFGWHVAVKKKEMRSPDLRYILVKDADSIIKGFTSLMPTFENHEPVVYCYEIHLKPELQGTGLGTQLMGYLVAIAENIPTVEKVMLTCFVSNTAGLKFYEKLGFDKDDHSPRERKLRGGKTVVPDYVILSRRTATGSTANSRQRRRQQ
ncbi:acyl-CoA N-acyltransferase [Dactylonectria macrodidyma]|uniref:N-alpha-acetyltransferase 40 n=1 Tax=Dactylonectria macrodidyma TaxID=307937 RepID=A0A9P9F7T7_9HYPO|nr:acyl-CoA N-acyltransferase [Dactylonectria macrodidyma]